MIWSGRRWTLRESRKRQPWPIKAWINHLAKPSPQIIDLLESDKLLTHRGIIGELACGNFEKRTQFLSDLKLLKFGADGVDDENLSMIEKHSLLGLGLGWMDCQLLASALVDGSALLTFDKALKTACQHVGVILL